MSNEKPLTPSKTRFVSQFSATPTPATTSSPRMSLASPDSATPAPTDALSRSAELIALSLLAAALIEKSGLSYFYTTSGTLNQPNIDRLKSLIKAFTE